MRVSDDKIFMLCQIHVVLYYMVTKEQTAFSSVEQQFIVMSNSKT